ncbi:MAG: four helix bundle protein [Saprospiraceae bacterium]|nr:four helix bundle protein [Candidatus Vicinibacter proximus]
MFDFQQLEVYKKAKAFHFEMQQIIRLASLHRSISDQLFRASLSVPLNIAEGSGRFSKSDRRNFFIIARSSIFETVAILDILHDSKHLSEQQFKNLLSNSEELSKILFAMIKNLEKTH